MSDSITVDAARLPLLLGELRLPTVAKLWQTHGARRFPTISSPMSHRSGGSTSA